MTIMWPMTQLLQIQLNDIANCFFSRFHIFFRFHPPYLAQCRAKILELQFEFLRIPLTHVYSLKKIYELSLFAKEQIQNLMCEKKKTMAIDNGKEMRI